MKPENASHQLKSIISHPRNEKYHFKTKKKLRCGFVQIKNNQILLFFLMVRYWILILYLFWIDESVMVCMVFFSICIHDTHVLLHPFRYINYMYVCIRFLEEIFHSQKQNQMFFLQAKYKQTQDGHYFIRGVEGQYTI